MLWLRYNDGDSVQWVQAMPMPDINSAVRYDTAQSATAAQQTQARQNMYAAPFDALAFNGLQVNGSMDVSQESGTTVVVMPTSGSHYIVDGTTCNFVHASAQFRCQQVALSGAVPGFVNSAQCWVSVAMASAAAANYAGMVHFIEGFRMQRLCWGTSSAMPLSVGFWIYPSFTGKMYLAVRNADASRSYLCGFDVTGGVWQYSTFTIPGETSGVWTVGNTAAISIWILGACGSNYYGTDKVWNNTNCLATAAIGNQFSTVGSGFNITGLVAIPGIELPSAQRLPLIARSIDQELPLSKRYYERNDGVLDSAMWSGNTTSGSTYYIHTRFQVRKRAAPAMTLTSLGTAGFPATQSMDGVDQEGFQVSSVANASANSSYYETAWIADARF
jgi:hypothetical protein